MNESPNSLRKPRAWLPPAILLSIGILLALAGWMVLKLLPHHRRAPAARAAPTPGPVVPFAAGATVGLLPITLEDVPDPNSIARFNLHIPIQARPNAQINTHALLIHVLFYDIVDGKEVVQTSANVTSRWARQPPEWSQRDTEELQVEYQLPKPHPGTGQRGDRKYFGYIVRLYYQQQLQTAVALPELL